MQKLVFYDTWNNKTIKGEVQNHIIGVQKPRESSFISFSGQHMQHDEQWQATNLTIV